MLSVWTVLVHGDAGKSRVRGLPEGRSASKRSKPAMAAADDFPPPPFLGALHRETKSPAFAILR